MPCTDRPATASSNRHSTRTHGILRLRWSLNAITKETCPAEPFMFMPLSAWRHPATSAGRAESRTSIRYLSVLTPVQVPFSRSGSIPTSSSAYSSSPASSVAGDRASAPRPDNAEELCIEAVDVDKGPMAAGVASTRIVGKEIDRAAGVRTGIDLGHRVSVPFTHAPEERKVRPVGMPCRQWQWVRSVRSGCASRRAARRLSP